MDGTKFCFDRDDKKSNGNRIDGVESIGIKDIAALVAAAFSVIAPLVLCCIIAVGAVFMLMRFLLL